MKKLVGLTVDLYGTMRKLAFHQHLKRFRNLWTVKFKGFYLETF